MKTPRILSPVAPLVALVLSLAGGHVADAATRNVPSTWYPTIQAALTASQSGDTVSVANGTYHGPDNTNLDFHGKNITVASASGNPALCVIDCRHTGRGFYFHSGESSAATVSGLTILNGDVQNYTYASNNSAPDGGGIEIQNAAPSVTHCVFEDCWAQYGGGVCVDGYGGATLTDCVFGDNSVAGNGGGCWLEGTSPITVTGCTFRHNQANGSISDWLNGLPGGAGGGVCDMGDSTVYTNCLFVANIGSYGGGLALVSCLTPVLTNCTFSDNAAGGIYLLVAWWDGGYSARPKTVTNCILYDDAGGSEIGGSSWPLSALTVTYSDVQGGWMGAGNINADPLFANWPSNLQPVNTYTLIRAVNKFGITSFQLRPLSLSLVFKAGTPAGAPAQDLAGTTRPAPPSMGAYEPSTLIL